MAQFDPKKFAEAGKAAGGDKKGKKEDKKPKEEKKPKEKKKEEPEEPMDDEPKPIKQKDPFETIPKVTNYPNNYFGIIHVAAYVIYMMIFSFA